MKYQGNKGCCQFSFNLISGYSFFVLEMWIFTLAVLEKGTSASSVLVFSIFFTGVQVPFIFFLIFTFKQVSQKKYSVEIFLFVTY